MRRKSRSGLLFLRLPLKGDLGISYAHRTDLKNRARTEYCGKKMGRSKKATKQSAGKTVSRTPFCMSFAGNRYKIVKKL